MGSGLTEWVEFVWGKELQRRDRRKL